MSYTLLPGTKYWLVISLNLGQNMFDFLDPEFIQFLESLTQEEEKLPSAEIYIEEIEAQKAIDKNSNFYYDITLNYIILY